MARLIGNFLFMEKNNNKFVFFVRSGKLKTVVRKVRIAIPAQSASVAPPLGPVLGQLGINIMDFCKQFNERSKRYNYDVVLNVVVFLFKDKSFEMFIKPPTVAFLVFECYNVFSTDPVNFKEVPLSFVYFIIKYLSLYIDQDVRVLGHCVRGTLRSMHLTIVDDVFSSKFKRF